MNTLTQSKQERVNLRLAYVSKETLERAASLEGKTIRKFILDQALTQAEQTIARHETLQLEQQEAIRFF